MEEFAEVRCDFYDDIGGYWCVDCWRTCDDMEEGECVAHIYDNGSVVWLNNNARKSMYVQEVINDCISDMCLK